MRYVGLFSIFVPALAFSFSLSFLLHRIGQCFVAAAGGDGGVDSFERERF